MAKLKLKNNEEGKIKMKGKSNQTIKKKKEVSGSKISKSAKTVLQQAAIKSENNFEEMHVVSTLTKKHQTSIKKPHVNNKKGKKVESPVKVKSSFGKVEKKLKNLKLDQEIESTNTSPKKIPKLDLSNKKGKGKINNVDKKLNSGEVEDEGDYKVTKEDVVNILMQLEKEDDINELKKKKGQKKDSKKVENENHIKSPQNKKTQNKKPSMNGTEAIPANDIKQPKRQIKETMQKNKNQKGAGGEKVPVKMEGEPKLIGKKRKHPKSKGKANEKNLESTPNKKVKLIKTEPLDFDEEKFNSIVNFENIIKVVEGLKTLVESEVAKKKTQIFADYHFMLQVTCFQIPYSPKRMVKLKLEHSLVGEGDDVLLIVKDLQRGSKVDHAPTTQHFEDLLREHNIKGITVMPFTQLRNEYKPFEMRRKLANTYDYFLCDSRVVRHASAFCGRIFQTPSRALHAVRMTNGKNIKSEIAKKLKCTAYKNFAKGNTSTIVVGTDKMTTKSITENILKVIEYIRQNYPGSLPNVRNLMLKINIIGTSALPIYISTTKVLDETPYVVGPKEQRMNELKKSVNQALSKFSMTKEGKITKLPKEAIENKRKIKEAKEALTVRTDDLEMENLNLIKNDSKIVKSKGKIAENNLMDDGKESEDDSEEDNDGSENDDEEDEDESD